MIRFGDPITNVCAGDRNPERHCYFVKKGRRNTTCTDKQGRFWDTDSQVIFPGHLDYEASKKLYAPIWEKTFGAKHEKSW